MTDSRQLLPYLPVGCKTICGLYIETLIQPLGDKPYVLIADSSSPEFQKPFANVKVNRSPSKRASALYSVKYRNITDAFQGI